MKGSMHKFCAINSPSEAALVSAYLYILLYGDGVFSPKDVRLGAEALRIHKNKYNHLLSNINHMIAELEKQKSAIAFTSSFACIEKTFKRKTFVKNAKVMIEETVLVWEDKVTQKEIDALSSIKALYEKNKNFLV